MTMLQISLFTDPACPWAFSAEPFRRKIEWLYGDHAAWELVMVGLAEDPAEFEAKGITTAMLSAGSKQIAAAHGMPLDTSERERLIATLPACRAVVAARLHSPGHQQTLLRAIQVRGFAGELIDEPATIAAAAADAQIDAHDLEQWSIDGETLVALASDMQRARHPLPAALVLDERLADWEGGRRYTCPSYEISVDDGEPIAIPGFQPWSAYDVALANLAPDLPRRAAPDNVSEVLEWAAEPLATREVAVVMGIEHDEAATALAEVAQRRDVGADSYWTL
jgi:predicted DsbA family dithiol-disulfide isomerase